MNKYFKSLPSLPILLAGITLATGASGTLSADMMDKTSFHVGILGSTGFWNKTTKESPDGIYQGMQAATADASLDSFSIPGYSDITGLTRVLPVGAATSQSLVLPNFTDANGEKGETLDKMLLGVGLCAGFSYPMTSDFYVGVNVGFQYNPGKSNNQKALYSGQYFVNDITATGLGTEALKGLQDLSDGMLSLKNRFGGYADVVLGHRRGVFAFIGGTYHNMQLVDQVSEYDSGFKEALSTKHTFGIECGLGVRAKLCDTVSVAVCAGYDFGLSNVEATWSGDTANGRALVQAIGDGAVYTGAGESVAVVADATLGTMNAENPAAELEAATAFQATGNAAEATSIGTATLTGVELNGNAPTLAFGIGDTVVKESTIKVPAFACAQQVSKDDTLTAKFKLSSCFLRLSACLHF